jgi:hypothetical protein
MKQEHALTTRSIFNRRFEGATHWRIFDRGDDLQVAAAVRTVFNVDVEDSFE